MRWWSRKRARGVTRRRFAELRAMAGPERRAALSSPDGAAWIEAAALYGLVEAQLLLAQLLLDRGDQPLALRWFRAAAGAGHAPAQNMVGRCLERGWGTPIDLPDAARHYRMAAEAGLDWAEFNLGMMLLYGLGVPRDRRAAFTWFTRAAEQGHAKAANMVGRCHEEGWDRPVDRAAAARFYGSAAAAGDCRAQFNLGTLLLAAGRRMEGVALLRAAWQAGPPDFQAEAAAALRDSGDPALLALTLGPAALSPAAAR